MSSLHERTTSDEGLSIEDKAAIANQRRVWEVRKYCQIRPSLARGGISSSRTSDDGASLHSEQDSVDAALTALLRGTLTLLEADIVRACIELSTTPLLMFAGHGLAPGRTYTIFPIRSYTKR